MAATLYGVQLDFNPLPTAVESTSRICSESLAKRVADRKHWFEGYDSGAGEAVTRSQNREPCARTIAIRRAVPPAPAPSTSESQCAFR